MAASAVDSQTLGSQDGNARAAWAGRDADWIGQHNRDIGFYGNPDEMFQVGGAQKSITNLGVELVAAGYTGPWDRGSIIAAYARTSGTQVLPYTPAPAHDGPNGRPGGTITDAQRQQNQQQSQNTTSQTTNPNPVIGGLQVAGNPMQWLTQSTRVLGVPMPNLVLVGAGIYMFMRRR